MPNFVPGFCVPDCIEQDYTTSYSCPAPANIPMVQGNFIADSIDNNLFWLRIMMEHALFMRLGFACINLDLINQAQEYEQEYSTLLNRAQIVASNPNEVNVRVLNENSIELAQLNTCVN
ncbi:MAG: DUF2935 domain-containing protein [Eubacteriales bacterium]